MNKKFLGCGFSRIVYDQLDGTVQKVALKEDYENGIIQNKNEYDNYLRASKLGLSCFPEVISHSSDFSKIIVRKIKTGYLNDTQKIYDILENYFSEKTTNYYLNGLYQGKFTSLFFFGAEEFLNYYLNSFPSYDVCNLDNLKNYCNNSCSRELRRYYNVYNMSPDYKWIASMIHEILTSDDSVSNTLKDIIIYYLNYHDYIIIADFWNENQWGFDETMKKLVIIDSGYSPDIQQKQSMKSFKIVPKQYLSKINNPNEDKNHFNGQDILNILSPTGNKIKHKFFTSHGSEYILSSDGMARRIKNANLADDGLWSWTSKTYFVNETELLDMMKIYPELIKKFRPIKVNYNKNTLSLMRINDNGKWENVFKFTKASTEPIVGMNTLEFIYTGKNIIKRYHPGHTVSVIEF